MLNYYSGTTRWCHSCSYWIWDKNIDIGNGEYIYPGHCGLESGTCINATIQHPEKKPPSHKKIILPDGM